MLVLRQKDFFLFVKIAFNSIPRFRVFSHFFHHFCHHWFITSMRKHIHIQYQDECISFLLQSCNACHKEIWINTFSLNTSLVKDFFFLQLLHPKFCDWVLCFPPNFCFVAPNSFNFQQFRFFSLISVFCSSPLLFSVFATRFCFVLFLFCFSSFFFSLLIRPLKTRQAKKTNHYYTFHKVLT